MSTEQHEPIDLRRLPDYYVGGAEELELTDEAEVNVVEKGDDVPENPHRRTQRSFERDMGPLGKAKFIRGEFPGEQNPDAGKRYETWTLPGELSVELGEAGSVTLTKVRTGSNRESDTKGGAESSWGDGEFAAIGGEVPNLDALEPASSAGPDDKGKTSETYDLGGGRTIFRERFEDGRSDHIYEKRAFGADAPTVELKVPKHGATDGERSLVTMRLTVDRIEANLDANRDPSKPMGRVKFRVEQVD